MDDELEPVAAMPAPRMSPTAYVCRCGRVIDPVRSRRDLWHAVRCLGTEGRLVPDEKGVAMVDPKVDLSPVSPRDCEAKAPGWPLYGKCRRRACDHPCKARGGYCPCCFERQMARWGTLPEVVVLCSTRFPEAWAKARYDLTLAGKIVLTIGCDTKSDDGLGITAEQKAALDELHKRKIDMADRVLVLNVGGADEGVTEYEADVLSSDEGVLISEADAALIAAMRNALPVLLDVAEAAADGTVLGAEHLPRGGTPGLSDFRPTVCDHCGRRWPCPWAELRDALGRLTDPEAAP